MKKGIAMLLIMVMCISLFVGCGSSDSGDRTTENGKDTITHQDTDRNEADIQDDTTDAGNEEENTAIVEENLYGYVPPTEVGAKLNTLTFELDSAYYTFPMPLSELLRHGWKIPDIYITDMLASGEVYEMALENEDGQILYQVLISNPNEEPIAQEQCKVIKILMAADEGYTVTLPEGISFGSTKEELEAVTERGNIIEQSEFNQIRYTWDDAEWIDSISACYVEGKGVVTFECISWE